MEGVVLMATFGAFKVRRGGTVRAAVAVTVSSIIALSACGGSDDGGSEGGSKVELRLSSIEAPTGAAGRSLDWWASEVGKRTDGRVTVKVFHAAALVPAADVLQALKTKRIDIGYVGGPFYPKELGLWQIASVPFVTSDAVGAANAFAKLYESNEPFEKQFSAQSIRPLMFLPIAPGLIASKSELTRTDQLKNKRLRAVGFLGQAAKSIGATPVALPTNEVYDNLERGTIEGVFGAQLDSIVPLGWGEAAPHLVDAQLGIYTSNAIAINSDVYDDLSSEDQKVIDTVSTEWQAEYLGLLATSEKASCDKLKAAGGEVTELAESEVDAMKSAVGDSLESSWSAASGASDDEATTFLDAYKKLLGEGSAASTYENGATLCAQQN